MPWSCRRCWPGSSARARRRGGRDADAAQPRLRRRADCPGPVLERALRQSSRDTGFVNAYGLTETASSIAVLGPRRPPAGVGVGRPGGTGPARLRGPPAARRRDRDPGRRTENPLGPGETGLVFVRGRADLRRVRRRGASLDDGRLVRHPRPGPARRRRLPVHRGPRRRHHHPGRREHRPRRDRGRPARLPGRRRGRRARPARRRVGPAPRRGAWSAPATRTRSGPGSRGAAALVQDARHHRVPPRTAHDRHRKAAAPHPASPNWKRPPMPEAVHRRRPAHRRSAPPSRARLRRHDRLRPGRPRRRRRWPKGLDPQLVDDVDPRRGALRRRRRRPPRRADAGLDRGARAGPEPALRGGPRRRADRRGARSAPAWTELVHRRRRQLRVHRRRDAALPGHDEWTTLGAAHAPGPPRRTQPRHVDHGRLERRRQGGRHPRGDGRLGAALAPATPCAPSTRAASRTRSCRSSTAATALVRGRRAPAARHQRWRSWPRSSRSTPRSRASASRRATPAAPTTAPRRWSSPPMADARLGLPALATVRSWASVGVDPAETGLAPTSAIPKALGAGRAVGVGDVDLFEINEAFAAMCVATIRMPRHRPGRGQRQRQRLLPRPPRRRHRRPDGCHARPRTAPPGRGSGRRGDVRRRRHGFGAGLGGAGALTAPEGRRASAAREIVVDAWPPCSSLDQ